jgi:hypothetical protein
MYVCMYVCMYVHVLNVKDSEAMKLAVETFVYYCKVDAVMWNEQNWS